MPLGKQWKAPFDVYIELKGVIERCRTCVTHFRRTVSHRILVAFRVIFAGLALALKTLLRHLVSFHRLRYFALSMRRGFLGSSACSGDNVAKTKPAVPIDKAKSPTSNPSSQSQATIEAKNDYTTIWQEEHGGLILQSDYRFDSPYFGYFPYPADGKASGPDMVYIDKQAEQIENAFKWPAWKLPPPMPIPDHERCFYIGPVSGKGLAMKAARLIKAGECIFYERPFYVSIRTKAIAPDMDPKNGGGFHRSATSRLGAQARRALLDLSNCYSTTEMDEISGKLATNYLPVDVGPRVDETKQYCGAFATLSRANHSCAPNTK